MAVYAWCFLVDGLIKGSLDRCERERKVLLISSREKLLERGSDQTKHDGIVEVSAAALERLELSTAYAPLNFPSYPIDLVGYGRMPVWDPSEIAGPVRFASFFLTLICIVFYGRRIHDSRISVTFGQTEWLMEVV